MPFDEREDVPAREEAPWLPENWQPAARPGYAKADPANAPTDEQRLLWEQLKAMQYAVWRKDRDAVGLYGAQEGFLYNARDSFNYSDVIGATITAVDGNEITLDVGYNPQNSTRYQSRQVEAELGITYITGFGGFGPAVQPGDLITFNSMSVLANKARPTVKRIVSQSGDTVTVEVGQDVSAAMTPVDPEYVGDFTCKVWNQDGNPEQWLHLQRPTYVRADKRVKMVYAGDLPENKILLLASARVAHPPGFNPPVFWIEGLDTETGEWVEIGGAESRLYIDTDIAGAYTSEVAFGTEKPASAHDVETPFGADLTETYQYFRVHYYLEDAEGCSIVAFGRCKHHRIDETRSVANYGAEDGVAIHGDGLHSFCARRKYPEFVLSDEIDRSVDPPVPGTDGLNDTLTIVWHKASGVATFPANGAGCIKTGCDKWETSEGDADKDAIWSYALHQGIYFRDLWGGCNTRVRQLFPGINYTWNFKVERILHAGIQWLVGMYLQSYPCNLARITYITRRDTQTPPSDFNHIGSLGHWGSASETYTDDDDNEFLRLSTEHSATWHNYARDEDEADPLIVGYEDGALPLITGFKTSRDPLDPEGSVTLNEIEQLGIRNVREGGEISVERGIKYAPRLHPSAYIEYLNCTTNVPDEPTEYDKGRGTWERLTEPDTFHDITEGAILKIKLLRQSAKSASNIGARTIDTVVSVVGNVITCDLENVRHTMSFPGSEPGTSRDLSWYAGGGPPIYPIDPKIQRGYNEPDKTVGSPAGGAMRGDACSIALDGFTDMRLVLTDVSPFGGAAADNWGTVIHDDCTVEVGGYFSANLTNLLLPDSDRHGFMTEPATGDFVKQGATVFTRVQADSIYRPASLAINTFWVSIDENRIYWSALNSGSVDIRYGVDGKSGDFDETHTIDTTPVMNTGFPYATWSGADDTDVTYYFTQVQNETGDTVSGYTATNVAGVLHMEFNGDDAGKIIRIHTETAGVLSDAPDPFTISDSTYPTYGKQKDRISFYDDSGVFIDNQENLEGLQISFHWADACWYGPIQLWYRAAGATEWILIDTADYKCEHGRGWIHFKESWFADKPTSVDFRVSVQMLDHRGFIGASLWNKTQAAIDGLCWVETSPTGGEGVLFGQEIVQDLQFGEVESCTVERGEDILNVVYPGDLPGGWTFNAVQGGYDIGVGGAMSGYVGIGGSGIGMPDYLQTCDDNTVIEEAYMEITGENVQTYFESVDNPGEIPTIEITEDALYFNLLRLHPGGEEWSIVGSIPANIENRTKVVECTALMQAWFNDRNSNESYTYLIMASGVEGFGDNLEEIVRSLMNPMPEVGVYTPPMGGPVCGVTHGEYRAVTWDNITIGKIHLRVSRESVETEVIPERLPPMDEVEP